MQTEHIASLELLLGHHFRDKSFIENALSHSSIKADNRPSNERMEFLGDSVLGLVVADVLYRRFPDDEGTLTRIKSQAVSRATLQRIALAMGLDRYILVGKGVAKREIPASLLGNMFEAIIGAIYLDAGLDAASKFVLRQIDIVIEEIVEDRAERNYKSILQHYCQRDLGAVPTYRVVRESGPAHGRAFEIAIVVSGKEYGRAKAESKKEAEQGAARAALIHFEQVDEKASDVTTRGAGTIVRVGGKDAHKPKPKRRRRGARRATDSAEAPARGKPEGGGRRRRGGRRASSKPTGDGEAAAAPVPARESSAGDAPAGDAPVGDAPVGDAPVGDRPAGDRPAGSGRRRRGSRGGRRRKRAGASSDKPREAESAPASPSAEKERRPPRRKKTVAKKAAKATKKTVVRKTATRKKRAPRKKKTGGE